MPTNPKVTPTATPNTYLEVKPTNDTRPHSSDSRRPSETPSWLLPETWPKKSSDRSRSSSVSYDTHQLSAEEVKWRQAAEAKQKNGWGKFLSYGFMK